MRPILLEMEGFSSFRQKAMVRFDDCDLFVLTGRTGSGKSSVIDALTFALYGSISRLDNAGAVAPVINQGSIRARVSLTFIAGSHRYTLTREVSRKSSTKAALERDDVPVAASVREVDREIASLLGLSFEQFTKSVVLPQGDFAEFLHANSKDRQDLLVKLLDAELFRRVQKQASGRASTLKADLDRTEHDLVREQTTIRHRASALGFEVLDDHLSEEDEDAAGDAGTLRVGVLSSLVKRVEAAVAELQRLATEKRAVDDEAERCRGASSQLEAVVTPPSLQDLQQRLDGARAAVRAAEETLQLAEDAQVEAEKSLATLPPRADVTAIVKLWEQHSAQLGLLGPAEGALAKAVANVVNAVAAQESAETFAARAMAEREGVLQQNHAFAAAQGLSAGDACPICGETLAHAPALPTPAGIDAAQSVLVQAELAVEAARRTVNTTGKTEAAAREKLDGLSALKVQLERELDGKNALSTCRESLDQIALAEVAVTEARDALIAARDTLTKGRKTLSALDDETTAAWTKFSERTTACAALGTPPHRKENDLTGSWGALEAWARAEAAAYHEKAQVAATTGTHLAEQAKAQAASQYDDCAALAVIVEPGQHPLLAANAAQTHAERDLADLQAATVERRRLDNERTLLRTDWQAAESLNSHLRANRFEQWYLEEALSRLLEGASATLRELSAGQYSLKLDENRKDFLVVDHTNADETRPVKTLSGGETFLASLSLALALADEIALLAPATAPRLEALFLDEGFGTLDPDTLDTVAGAIEELGARGRMVGIVTHVPELAERVPVRFKVTKVGGTSRIDREP